MKHWLLILHAHRLPLTAVVLAGVLAACQSNPSAARGARDPAEAARTRTAIAAQYIRHGDLDAAQRHLELALAAEPDSVEALTMMGVLLQTEGSQINLQKADGFFRRAIGLDSRNAQAHNNYGVYLFQTGRHREAANQFAIAAATLGYEGRASALENLGRVQKLLGQSTEAEKSLMQALAVDNSLLAARLELADLLFGRGRIADAASAYSSYLRQLGTQPQSARALWLGMKIARLQQDMTQVRAYAEQLRQRYPDSAEFQTYQKVLQNPGQPWK